MRFEVLDLVEKCYVEGKCLCDLPSAVNSNSAFYSKFRYYNKIIF